MNLFNYLFEKSRYSHRQFLLGNHEELNYDILFQDVITLALDLREMYGEDNRIILASPNSVFFITAYLAIIKSGNICVPLNPSIESQNLDYIIDECKASIAYVSQQPEDPKWKAIKNMHVALDIDQHAAIESSHYFLFEEDFDENRLAEVIYTSGSTGKPKGVMISHKNIIANTNSIVQYLHLSSTDIIEVVLPFYYCYGLSLLHTHLRVGGSIVLNNNFMFLGSVINDLIKYRCTGFAGVPSHFQILLRKSKAFKKSSFPDLRYITQAGGKLHTSFQLEFRGHFPNIDFFVMYGQTEATARLSYLPPMYWNEKMGSIGIAIPGVELDLLDKDDNPVLEPGTVGELVARGDNVMLGYLNDPEGTEIALKNAWLHTSDLAYRDEDGFYFISSRKEEIIKVGGERISPKEIEALIVSMPEVLDCSITGIYDDILGESIKAVIVPADSKSTSLDAAMVKEYCSKHLASNKIPSEVQFQASLDIAATGKKVKK